MDRDSLEDYTAEEMLVLATDGLHLQEQEELEEEEEEGECPDTKSLIVTNVDLEVFMDDLAKADFEARFLAHESAVTFYYIRTFRRVRVDFRSRAAAAAAKAGLEAEVVGDNAVHCYWLRVLRPSQPGHLYLAPPPLEKQFLISPPCSPPVGWEQPKEDRPVVDYELLAALAQLGPGDNHELQPRKSVTICGKALDTPSIVVHVCEGGTGIGNIQQTRCPERQASLED